MGKRKLDRMDTWIVADAEHLASKERVRGTRISIALLLGSLAAGMSIEELVDVQMGCSLLLSIPQALLGVVAVRTMPW
jgi:uncharacterized protein (DUF433 family)